MSLVSVVEVPPYEDRMTITHSVPHKIKLKLTGCYQITLYIIDSRIHFSFITIIVFRAIVMACHSTLKAIILILGIL